jgi:hypothetical protein
VIASNEMPLSAQDARCQVSSASFGEDVVVWVAIHAAIDAEEQHENARQGPMESAVEKYQQCLQQPRLVVGEYA